MHKREYLRSLGFEVGERGRFSAEMLEALRHFGAEESQNTLNTVIEQYSLDRNIIRTPRRESQELYGYDKEGHKIGFITCFECGEHMMWCECDHVTAPTSVAVCKNPLVRLHPNMVQSSPTGR